jgi:alpha-mannosidase
MINRTMISISIVLLTSLALAGCMDLKPYQYEGDYYRQQVISADKVTAEEYTRLRNSQPITTNKIMSDPQTDSDMIIMKKDNIRTSDRFMGSNTLGTLKTYDPPTYSRQNNADIRHQQDLRRIEQRQQQEIYNSSRLRR